MNEKKGKKIFLDKKTMDLIKFAAEKTGKTPEQVVEEAVTLLKEKYAEKAENK